MNRNNDNLLIWIFFLVRVTKYVQNITTLNMHHYLFETDTSLGFKLFVLLIIPFVIIHKLKNSTMCALCQHIRGV